MVLATLAVPFDEPFFVGSPTGGSVPAPYDVALNGRPYMLQLDATAIEVFGQHARRQSLPLVRDQADQGDEPGEHSVSPENFWRRSQQSWHHGAGQSWLDWGSGSDRNRFRSSKGVNVWTQKALTLLNTTSRTRTSANSGLRLCMAGSRAYLADGQTLLYSVDGTSWTTVTGTPAATCSSVTSDGFNVYAAYGASGIYKTDTGSGAATSHVTGNVAHVAYVKGRLMAANANSIYNVTAAGALPTALFTHANTAFTFVKFTEAPGFIYAAGFAGGRSEIYSITITDTATALGAPKVCAVLPEGEIIRTIYGYLGFVVVGSDKGVRLASQNTDGSLVLGGLITTPSVQCFDAQDRFVWFGWTNYDGTSTGLGRIDLSVFTSTLTPAYASDLMATTQGTVSSTVLLGSTRLFTVDGSGVWLETLNTPVASGTLLSGFIGYDLADTKQAVYLDMRHEPLPAGCTITAGLAVDNGAFSGVATSSLAGATAPAAFYLNAVRAERFEIQLTLNGSGATAPTLTRYTLRADVTASPSSLFLVPLMIADRFTIRGTDTPASAGTDYDSLIDLHATQRIFPYQEGNRAYQVKMVDYEWLPQHRSTVLGDFNGVFVAHLRHITG